MPNSVGTSGRFLLIKSIASAVLCHQLVGRVIGLVCRNRIPHRGSRIEVPAKGDPRVTAKLFWGVYESAEIRFVNRYLGNDLDVVELGSSLGGVSCQIAKKLGGKAKLICVEANEAIFPLMRRNVTRNAPSQDVQFVHGAIDYSGRSVVDLVIGDSNLSSSVCNDACGTAQQMRVPAITLSGLLESTGIGDYALVSDIEGAEAGLLNRDTRSLKRCKKMIIELHETMYDGSRYTVQSLVDLIQEDTGMVMRDRYGSVCVFDK